MALPDRVALDACALIHWADPSSPYAMTMGDWMRLGLLAGQVELSGSTALLIEARGGGLASPNPEAEKRIRDALLDPKFVLVNLDRATAVLGRQLAINHGLRTWDAVHLASAVRFGADVLLTTDDKLLGIGQVEATAILKPYPPDGSNLFNQTGDGD